jgi:DNA-binding MarR family transcriptional regulator
MLLNISLQENITVTELADILIMDQTTVTRNLEILSKKGYIQIRKGRDDHRKRNISLTAKGQDKLLETIPLWEKAQSAIVNQVGLDEFNRFLHTLSKIAALAK